MSAQGDKIIPPPKHCNCGNPAVLIRIEVYHPRGPVMVGGFSDFGQAKTIRGKTRLTLRPGYRYRRWIAQCITCVQHELQPELSA